ncbi:class I SAM-dependent methyltransferase [Devosia pacifica]|nr:class I SAM-dependent methyltransferase [Devosia pacifica]
MTAKRSGASFEDADVVANYVYRPPYPDALFTRLVEIAPAHAGLLDIGCGPGKIARPMAAHFGRVTAVDPSHDMLALARTLPGGGADNIEWIEDAAEHAQLGQRRFGLIVAAASIHWMQHEVLFPHLASHASRQHVVAVIGGDDAHEPPWQQQWLSFLTKWVFEVTGERFDPAVKSAYWQSYRPWLEIKGEEQFTSQPFEQSVADFIRCQHSRDTFTAARLGPRRADFDAELAELLMPHAINGRLVYRIRTSLVWGSIRAPS